MFCLFPWAKLKISVEMNVLYLGCLLEKSSGMGKGTLPATKPICWPEQPHTCPAGWLVRASGRFASFWKFFLLNFLPFQTTWISLGTCLAGFGFQPSWIWGPCRLMTWKTRNADRKTLKLWEKGSLEPASCEEDCDLFLDGVWRGKGSGSSFRATALYLTCVSLKSDSPSHEGSGVPRVQQVLSFPS